MSYQPASNRPTKRIQLVSDPEQWVDYYTKLNWGDRKTFNEASKGFGSGGADITISVDLSMARLLKDWSLTDKDGGKLPLDQASFDLLEVVDADAIAGALAEVLAPRSEEDEAKKKVSTPISTSPSTPATATTPSPTGS